jgi:3-oxoacyl-[acyl-carrier protein] reductase
MEIRLTGRHALVTGGSKGIGRAIAEQFAATGARVTLVARDASELKKLVAQLPGGGHNFIAADFSKTETALTEIQSRVSTDPIDILVNNTGGPPAGLIENATWEQFVSALEMHVKMAHSISQFVIPHMRKQHFGRIINVISTSVKIPIAGLGVSNTTRGAMASWAKTLATEIAKDGITVNNILPGFVETGRLESLIAGKAKGADTSIDAIATEMINSIPAGRFGKPEELAYYATFLASDRAGYITGTSLQIDGGRTGSL